MAKKNYKEVMKKVNEVKLMPQKNHFFENLKPYHDVEERKGKDPMVKGAELTYWVATIDNVPGVVIMDGQHQKAQQKALDVMVKDTKMRKQGYTCKISHPDIGEPLYFKTTGEVGAFLRMNHTQVSGVKASMIVKVETPVVIVTGPSTFETFHPVQSERSHKGQLTDTH